MPISSNDKIRTSQQTGDATSTTTNPTVKASSHDLCMIALNVEFMKYLAHNSSNDIDYVKTTLEYSGFQTGVRLAERLTLNRPRLWDQRETVKFICKDVWTSLFQKQADRLQTNRRGGYVIFDNSVPWLKRLPTVQHQNGRSLKSTLDPPTDRLSESKNQKASKSATPHTDKLAVDVPSVPIWLDPSVHLAFPCGVLRGALTNFGWPCQIAAEVLQSPACSFEIRIGVHDSTSRQ